MSEPRCPVLRTVTENVWDTAPGKGMGKLHSAEQHNYIVFVNNLPWSASPGEDVRVKNSFRYDGIGGRESQRDTRVAWSDSDVSKQVVFRQEFSYTDLGDIGTYIYPECIDGSPDECLDSDAGDMARELDYNYANGFLVNIKDVTDSPLTFDWANWTYHNSGTWSTITHENEVVEHHTLDTNRRNRTKRIRALDDDDNLLFDTGNLAYDGAGNLKTAGATRYTYDKVGRLAASFNTGENDQSFFYDRFGNMFVDDLEFQLHEIDPETNRFNPGEYDNAGNLLTYLHIGGQMNWSYNAQNKVAAQNGRNYVYDAAGERIATFTANTAKYHLRDNNGQRRGTVAYTRSSDSWQRISDFIVTGRRILASTNPQGQFHYHADQLGSTRLITDAGGNDAHEYKYAPYGFEYVAHYNSTNTPYFTTQFTGQEKDFSTGANYMHARHYHSQLGRFTSLDPVRGDASEPQSLKPLRLCKRKPLN